MPTQPSAELSGGDYVVQRPGEDLNMWDRALAVALTGHRRHKAVPSVFEGLSSEMAPLRLGEH